MSNKEKEVVIEGDGFRLSGDGSFHADRAFIAGTKLKDETFKFKINFIWNTKN